MKNNFLVVLAALLMFGCNGNAQKERKQAKSPKGTYAVGFYNVENLYDTIDQPHNDEEFLPNGKNKWTSERYLTKLKNLNQVIDEMDNVALLGVCEIENAEVLKDLNAASTNRKNFQVVHFDSKDGRGVDVGMIYNPDVFKLNDAGFVRYMINNNDTYTRDIVWGKFVVNKDTVFALVNHWPSRRNGEKDSEPNRIIAAESAAKFIDSVLASSPASKIIFMGDLNDYPTNKSAMMIAERLTPMIDKSSGKFGGSYNYKQEWDVLDHMMVSPNSFKGSFKVVPSSGEIISEEFMLEEFKGNIVPRRNYAGSNYLEGYSDHLPVQFSIQVK